MIIRKQYTLNNAHIVRNCYSDRCKYSLHAHTAIIETFYSSNKVDNAGMLMDFGLGKVTMKPFVELHQNAVLMWKEDSEAYKDFVKSKTDNWIELTFTPSAELLAAYFQLNFSTLLDRIQFANNEDESITLIKTRYHETRTGFAEADQADLAGLLIDQKWILMNNQLGPAVIEKLKKIDNELGVPLFSDKPIVVEAPKQQIKRKK